MFKGCIYCALSPSKKKYYGYSLNFKGRKATHIKNARNGKINHFYTAIRKYGVENIEWLIIEEYENEDKIELKKILCEREIYWIERDKTYLEEFGYNMTKGGDGRVGIPHSKESKEKLSKSLKGKKKSPETRKKMSESAKGRVIPEEQREKIRKSLTGRKQSKETIKKRSIKLKGKPAWNKGKPAWNKGKKHTPEHTKNQSEGQKGQKRPKNKAYRKKISEGLKRYHRQKNKNND